MTILIANIGTSDLAIQIPIDGESYYLPIDFLADEPNLEKQKSKLTPLRRKVWDDQRKYIEEHLYKELGFDVGIKQSSRKITEIMLRNYQENPRYWHPRLKPVRIGGAIQKAISLGVKKACIFVTDQQTKDNPNGHDKDTINLYSILEKWLQEEGWEFSLEWQIIPADIPGNDQDLLLDYYYKTVNEVTNTQKLNRNYLEDEIILISTKGGTNQMKVALQVQTMASSFKNPIFLNPDLSIDRILDGQVSDCKLVSYWRYRRSQKYQTVRQLLSRWDFDGAIGILEDWLETLESLISIEIEAQSISDNKRNIGLAIEVLKIAIACFNLDITEARRLFLSGKQLDLISEILDNYDQGLNLCAQCRIYWRLNQIANFLSRLSSFCEETIEKLIKEFSDPKYFAKSKPGNWSLDRAKMEDELCNYLASKKSFDSKDFKDWNSSKTGCFRRRTNRFVKRDFLDALIKFRGTAKEILLWQDMLVSLAKLDYWIGKRNALIHGAKGISKESMFDLLEEERTEGSPDALAACDRDQILAEVTKISRKTAELLNLPESPFVGLDTRYYIYSDVQEWVINKLMTDGLL